MKKKIPLSITLSCLAVSIVGLFLMLNLTNPLDSDPIIVLVVFSLSYVFVFSTLLILLRLSEIIYHLMRTDVKKVIDKNVVELTNLRKNLIVAAVSFIPIFIMSMNSIGQLGLVDLALIAIIEIILIFYIIRRTAR